MIFWHRYVLVIPLIMLICMGNSTASTLTTVTIQSNNTNQVNNSDRALLQSSTTGNFEEVKYHLKQGANPDATAQDRNRRSALIIAAAGGYTDIIEALLVNGAQIDYRDSAGLTALNWSVLRSRNEVTKYLLSKHADANISDNRDITPVMYAVGTSNTKTLKLLKSNGAALDAKSKASKMTPLLIAIENGDHEMVLTLLKLGARVNNTNHDEHTPLMSATESGNIDIVNTLISYGADTTLKNLKGMTALALARKNGFKKIEEILTALGKTD